MKLRQDLVKMSRRGEILCGTPERMQRDGYAVNVERIALCHTRQLILGARCIPAKV